MSVLKVEPEDILPEITCGFSTENLKRWQPEYVSSVTIDVYLYTLDIWRYNVYTLDIKPYLGCLLLILTVLWWSLLQVSEANEISY